MQRQDTGGQMALRALVRGRVQGVFFRAFTVEQARRLGLTGWAANRADGETVEVRAEGPRPALEQLVTALRVGPPSARVDDIEVEWSPARGEWRGFRVR
jgi:acylphosphatase